MVIMYAIFNILSVLECSYMAAFILVIPGWLLCLYCISIFYNSPYFSIIWYTGYLLLHLPSISSPPALLFTCAGGKGWFPATLSMGLTHGVTSCFPASTQEKEVFLDLAVWQNDSQAEEIYFQSYIMCVRAGEFHSPADILPVWFEWDLYSLKEG